jgi:hypothetical protein
VTLPILKQVPSPNYSERSPPTIDLVIIHDCEGSYYGSIAVFSQENGGRSVSAHLVLNDDGSECTQMVPFAKKAWHVCNLNSRSIGVEMAGFKAKGFSAAELNTDAEIVAWLLKKFNIPCQDAQGGARPGFTSHYACGAAGGGHTDPTTDPAVWAGYVARVQAAYAALGDGPLPPWGLSSHPPALAASAPPAVPAGWAPSGTVRKEAADVAGARPIGSLTWAQDQLNAIGTSPQLTIDGVYGPLTASAVAKFQAACGLPVDAILGSHTIAALEAIDTPPLHVV